MNKYDLDRRLDVVSMLNLNITANTINIDRRRTSNGETERGRWYHHDGTVKINVKFHDGEIKKAGSEYKRPSDEIDSARGRNTKSRNSIHAWI